MRSLKNYIFIFLTKYVLKGSVDRDFDRRLEFIQSYCLWLKSIPHFLFLLYAIALQIISELIKLQSWKT